MKNSVFNAVCKTRYLALLVLLIFTCGNAWGATVTISGSDTWTGGKSGGGAALYITKGGITINISSGYKASASEIRWYSGATMSITSSVGNITEMAFTISQNPSSISVPSGSSGTYNSSTKKWTGNSNSFSLRSSAQVKWSSVTITYTAASCTNPPTIGTVSANGPFTWNTSFPLSVSSIGAGTGCSISEYGFVWKSGGSEPTISDNKTKIGESSSATSFSGNITGTFATGTTYKVKAYVTNNGGTTTLSSAYTLVARTVTFNMNGHGDAPATQYVANGEKASQPANPSATGWTFGGWYKEAGCSNVWNFASETVSGGNKNIYAKWTAKTTTVSFNQNSGTGGQTTSQTATYDAAMPTPITTPTRDHYTFDGYYDGAGGTGTKYYNADGSSAKNWDKEDATWTLYAKWTAEKYTVTWSVNGSTYTTTANVPYNTTTATPANPTPSGDCAGLVFRGWTATANYKHATDAPNNMFNGTSPAITGDITFHAVFAEEN